MKLGGNGSERAVSLHSAGPEMPARDTSGRTDKPGDTVYASPILSPLNGVPIELWGCTVIAEDLGRDVGGGHCSEGGEGPRQMGDQEVVHWSLNLRWRQRWAER